MYTLKDNGVLKEIECGNNFEYILENSAYFVNTDYKVLQSQTNDIFVKCMKMMRNGKLDLYYITDDYRPMSTMFVGITPDILITVVINLFANIIDVRNNGFLNCQNIDMSWDKIFVESKTLKVRLVYIPVNVKVFDSYSQFESELRSCIIKLINKVITEQSERMEQFVLDLSNGTLSLEDVYNKSRSANTPPIIKQQSGTASMGKQISVNTIKIVAMNVQRHFEIVVDRDEMFIGKKKELVDAVISFNNMISRKHCKISRLNGDFYITDMGSANGTYVNRVRISQGQQYPIHRGDIIRLADSDFQIV